MSFQIQRNTNPNTIRFIQTTNFIFIEVLYDFFCLFPYSRSSVFVFKKWSLTLLVFCLVCLTNFFFFAFSQTIKLFFIFSSSPFIFMWKVSWTNRENSMKTEKKSYMQNVEHTHKALKRCLKHKILFLLHMLSSFWSNAALESGFCYLVYRSLVRSFVDVASILTHQKKPPRWERNSYQIIIFVLSLMIAGVANGNCARHTLHNTFAQCWFGCHYLRFFFNFFAHISAGDV